MKIIVFLKGKALFHSYNLIFRNLLTVAQTSPFCLPQVCDHKTINILLS